MRTYCIAIRTYMYICSLPFASMFSQVTSIETVQQLIALLRTNDSCIDPADSFTLISGCVKVTVVSISTNIKYVTN